MSPIHKLKAGGTHMSDNTQGRLAAALHRDLTRAFGGVVFRVLSESTQGTSLIEVEWVDGPPLYAAEAVVRKTVLSYTNDGGTGHNVPHRISKRRTMSLDAEEKILSLLGTALGLEIEDFDSETLHPTPPLLALPHQRFTAGTVPEFMDRLFERMPFCTHCPAPTSGGGVKCPCILTAD